MGAFFPLRIMSILLKEGWNHLSNKKKLEKLQKKLAPEVFHLQNNQSKMDWRCGSWPVILATQEAEIRRIVVQGQSRKIVWEAPSPK
jgi:hypothetical protein